MDNRAGLPQPWHSADRKKRPPADAYRWCYKILRMKIKLEALKKYAQESDRVCPVPDKWNQLWEMLPNRKRTPSGSWTPPLPLILSAWWETPASMKRLRLYEHLEYAAQNGVLEDVDLFLKNLPEKDWAHLSDF